MLKTRIKTGIVLTAVVLPFIYFSYLPYVTNIFAALLSFIGTYELFRAANRLNEHFLLYAAFILSVGLPFALPLLPIARVIVFTAFFAAVISFFVFAPQVGKLSFDSSRQAFLVSLANAALYTSLPLLANDEHGRYYICLVVLTSVCTEVSAYCIGKAVGKRKLAPRISPGKTVAGCVGGIAVSCVLVMIFGIVVNAVWLKLRLGVLACYIVLASALGQIGDLSMSLIKRSAGIKDFGALLPGHGGLLDRFDSQLFIAPLTLTFSVFFPIFG